MQLCSEEIDFQIPFIQQKLEVQVPQYLIVFQEEWYYLYSCKCEIII